MSALRGALVVAGIYAGLLILLGMSTVPSVEDALAALAAALGPVEGLPLAARVEAARRALDGRAFPGVPGFPWADRALALQLAVSGLLAVQVGRGWLAGERLVAGVAWLAAGACLLLAALATGTSLLLEVPALRHAGALLSTLGRAGAGTGLLAFLVYAAATTRSWAVRLALGGAALALLDAAAFTATGGATGGWARISPLYRLGSGLYGLGFDLLHPDLRGLGWLLLGDLLLPGADPRRLLLDNVVVGLLGVAAWARLHEQGRDGR